MPNNWKYERFSIYDGSRQPVSNIHTHMRVDETYINEDAQIFCISNYCFVCLLHFVT